jgi:hypothetical protein
MLFFIIRVRRGAKYMNFQGSSLTGQKGFNSLLDALCEDRAYSKVIPHLK